MYTGKQKLIIILEGALAGVYAAIMVMDALKYLHRTTPATVYRRAPDVTGVTGNDEDEWQGAA